jgi:hypothetical protein
VNTTALIIGAAAIGGLFLVWRAASQTPPPAAPAAAPQSCSVSYGGAGVSCGAIKQTVATAQKDVIAASKGIGAVPGALFGTNATRGLFASATGQLGGGGFTGVARGNT